MEQILDELYESILDGDVAATKRLVQQALEQAGDPDTILQDGMISAMTEVGRLFEIGEAFVPEMLIAALAMQSGLGILRPHLVAADTKPVGKALLGTVAGDMHDIGKNLVGMMLEGAGYEIIDLGVDVSAETFVQTVEADPSIDIVGLSVMLTTTMPQMRVVVDAFKRAEIYDDVKIIVGGAPVTAEFATAIDAHGYAQDASQAVALVNSFME